MIPVKKLCFSNQRDTKNVINRSSIHSYSVIRKKENQTPALNSSKCSSALILKQLLPTCTVRNIYRSERRISMLVM